MNRQNNVVSVHSFLSLHSKIYISVMMNCSPFCSETPPQIHDTLDRSYTGANLSSNSDNMHGSPEVKSFKLFKTLFVNLINYQNEIFLAETNSTFLCKKPTR